MAFSRVAGRADAARLAGREVEEDRRGRDDHAHLLGLQRHPLRVAQLVELHAQRLLAGGQGVGLGPRSDDAANDACCMEVLKRSSPTMPPTSTRLTSVTNGTRGARVRTRGHDGEARLVDGLLGDAG